MHWKQFHQFKYSRNRILEAINIGYVHFCVYKSIPLCKNNKVEIIQFALVNQIMCRRADSKGVIRTKTIHQNPFLVKCIEIINKNSKKPEYYYQNSDYVLSNVTSEMLFNKKRPTVEEIKYEYPHELVVNDSPISPPNHCFIPKQKTKPKNLIRKFIKCYKSPRKSNILKTWV